MRTLVLSLLVALVATPALALAGPAQASTTPAPASPTATSAPDPAADKAAKEKAAKQEAAKKKAAKVAKKKAAKAARKKAARQKARRAAARNWDRLAECESNGRWRIDTGNGYYGGLQISPRTWRAFGGARIAALPHHATKKQQIKVATRIKEGQGWGAWPSCSRRVGLR